MTDGCVIFQYKVLLFHKRYEGPALTIQRYFRGWSVRRHYRRERAVIVIQKYTRSWRVRHIMRREMAAIVVQKYFRGWKVRKYSVTDQAAIAIQKHFRGWKARQLYRLLRAVVTIQSFYRGMMVGQRREGEREGGGAIRMVSVCLCVHMSWVFSYMYCGNTYHFLCLKKGASCCCFY